MERWKEQSPVSPPEQEIYTVSRLNREAKLLLEAHYPLVWLEGEVSNLSRPSSGHLYFSLKDRAAQIRCALFRGQQRTLRALPKDGMRVLVRARVTLYEGRGDFQLVIHYLEEAGEGALRQAFEALKARLDEEGLFGPAHKRPLPRLPRRIGVVTSPTGAAIHDVLSTLKRRFPAIPVLLYPVPVQGEGAAAEIAAALQLASARRDCDALILTRGGGSLEDLRAFNEETVARAVFTCTVPIVCGVGHEIDFTIADLVADQRAPTPTAAAEMLSPDQAEWRAELAGMMTRLRTRVGERLTDRQQRLDWLAARLIHPQRRIVDYHRHLRDLGKRLQSAHGLRRHRLALTLSELAARLDQRSPAARLTNLSLRLRVGGDRLTRGMRLRVARARDIVDRTMQRLHDVSPLATLERGYAIVHTVPDHVVVTDAAQVQPGERVEASLRRGGLVCVVEKTR